MSKLDSKKRKTYWKEREGAKRRKGVLMTGMRGFLCTCNGNMKGCIREAYNILDQYSADVDPNIVDVLNENEEKDIEDELKEELLKAKNEKREDKKFQAVETGANNCIFISTTLEKTTELAEMIIRDADKTKQAKGRFLIRLLPVEITCKAYLEDIKKGAEGLLDLHFRGAPTTFAVLFNRRHNSSVVREELVGALALLVRDRNPQHKVHLKNPAKAIVVEIIKNICCLSIVNDFFALRKYNLIELASNKTLKA